MKNDYNLIYDDEVIYGLLGDIRTLFNDIVDSGRLEDDDEVDIYMNAIKDIDELTESDEYGIYKCWYNPMGAYIFTPMKEAK